MVSFILFGAAVMNDTVASLSPLLLPQFGVKESALGKYYAFSNIPSLIGTDILMGSLIDRWGALLAGFVVLHCAKGIPWSG